jgi:predicted acetyltransferase
MIKKRFAFRDPGKLTDGELHLVLVNKIPADEAKGFVPSYEFNMVNAHTREIMGGINLRIGYNERIKYGGQIGYAVGKEYRGKRYAARSLKLLFPLVKRHGLDPLWVTCDPDNTASRKTCELAGGTLVEVVDIPKNSELYKRGERKKCRYRFDLRDICEKKARSTTNRNIVIKKSSIDHKGVFAARDFKKGEVVMNWSIVKTLARRDLPSVLPVDEKYISYMGKGKYVIMGAPSRFVNHSCDANTKAVNGADIARRDIRKGEEITADYAKEKAPHRFVCNCGSAGCRKVIGEKKKG